MVTKHDEGGQIKENEMDWPCSTYETETHPGFCYENLKEKRPLET